MTFRSEKEKPDKRLVGSISRLWRVLAIGFLNSRISAGISRKTVIILIKTPFDSTMPMSKPIVKVINNSAASPATVVRQLENTEAKLSLKARVKASSASSPSSVFAL